MSINNREDANKYYQIMNELVDEYIDKWKIRPAKLKKYCEVAEFKSALRAMAMVPFKLLSPLLTSSAMAAFWPG